MSTYNASNLINLCVNKGLTFSSIYAFLFALCCVGFVQVLMKLSKSQGSRNPLLIAQYCV